MDLKSKVLLWVLCVLLLLSVSATFYKTVILQDFDYYESEEFEEEETAEGADGSNEDSDSEATTYENGGDDDLEVNSL